MKRIVVAAALLGASVLGVIAFAEVPARGPCTNPSIFVKKSQARLELRCTEGTRTYPVTFGATPVGQKMRRGDEKTPEGTYEIESKAKRERFDRFLLLSYPTKQQRREAKARGDDPGGEVGIHGVRAPLAALARLFIRSAGALSSRAWGPTDGCIAMINEDVEALYDVVPVGTSVTIVP